MASMRCLMQYVFVWIVLIYFVKSTPSTSPTMEPTPEPTEPTAAPTSIGSYCNIFDGTTMDNLIQVTHNSKISDLEITEPLRIKFNFTIHSSDICVTEECNLIQFGSHSSVENVSFPRVSIFNQAQNSFTWNITLQIDSNSDHISIPSSSMSSSFDITISDKTVIITIGSISYTETLSFTPQLSGLHPFYASSDCCYVDDSFNATIDQLCISTDSQSPTKRPTPNPTLPPTTLQPTVSPTASPTVIQYTKIDCYTETATAGASTVECTSADYFATSCGIQYIGSFASNDTFFRGIYIERLNPNELELDPVCYIDYGSVADTIRANMIPEARCCNFKEQYGDLFKCRYFNSVDRLTDALVANKSKSSESAASKANQVSYVTCNDEYPFLLGCTPYIDTVDAVPNTTADIYVYGSFVAEASASQTDTYYNKYYSLFDENIAFPPTTFTPTQYGDTTKQPTTQPTVSPTATVSFYITTTSAYSQCVAQYGPNTHNYSVMAIATCCTESYDIEADAACCIEPTPAPASMPSIPPTMTTDIYGRGANLGDTLTESGSDGAIVGITKWGIIQVIDKTDRTIPYQGLIIGAYKLDHKYNLDGNETENIEEILADSDYDDFKSSEFEEKKRCASFELDEINGTRDYIDGFDLFWTRFAIIGVRFYSKFGRIYSCPDDQTFSDDSIEVIFGDVPLSDITDENGFDIRPNDYNISNVSVLNAFAANGTYQLSGWQITKQTRELFFGLERSVMAKIGFIFLLDKSTTGAPTSSPTQAPTPSPTPQPTIVSTPAPLFPGQSAIGSETLECYSIWGQSDVKCSDNTTDTMTSCSAYSANDQIFSTFIEDYNQESICKVEIWGNDTSANAAASAVCCHFYVAPARDYDIFIWTSITGGVLYGLVVLVLGFHWNFLVRTKVYFVESDIDKDGLIDEAFESDIHATKAKKTVEDKQVNKRDLKEMIELQRQISDESIGLI